MKKDYMKNIDFVREIKDNVLYLKNNKIMAIIEVDAIDLNKLTKNKRKLLLDKYEMWINSLSFPIQIIGRTVNSDIHERIKIVKNKVEHEIKQKENPKEIMKQYLSFAKWLENYIVNIKTKRKYYVVIPYLGYKSFFNNIIKKSENKNPINILNKRIMKCINALNNMGITCRKLNTNKINNLLNSYFSLYVFKQDRYVDVESLIRRWQNAVKE